MRHALRLTISISTHNAQGVRLAVWLVGVGLLLGTVHHSVAYQPPICISRCDLTKQQPFDCCAREAANGNPDLTARCSRFLGCKGQQQATLDSNINENCSATLDGRCTVLAGCVKEQQGKYQSAVRSTCVQSFLGDTSELCPVRGSRARRDIDRVCSGCVGVAPAPTTTTSTTVRSSTSTVSTTTGTLATTTSTTRINTNDTPPVPDDPCYRGCLGRIDSLQTCYSRCKDKCENNQRATEICRAGCRNGGCTTIKARCNGGAPKGSPDKDPAKYQACCNKADSCLTREDAPCKVIPTTTSSSTTTSTSLSPTTSTTTTTLGTVLGIFGWGKR